MTRYDVATHPGSGQSFVSTHELQRLKSMTVSSASGSPGLPSYASTSYSPTAALEEDRIRLKALSDARVSTWSNTLDGARTAQLQAAQTRLAADEARLRALDAQEESRRAAERAAILAKADAASLRTSSDKVRSFEARLLLSECLQGRASQIDAHHKKEEYEARKAREHHANLESTWAAFDDKQVSNAIAKRDAALKLANERAAQIGEKQRREAAEAEAMEAEKAREREREKERAREEKEKSEREREAGKARLRELRDANMELGRSRERERAQEKAEEDKIAQYAAEKAAKEATRKAREDERFGAQLARRQKLIDEQAAMLAAMRSTEEARVDGQVRAAEEARAEREREDARRKSEYLAATKMSRDAQIAEKKRRAERDREARGAVQMQLRQLADVLAEEDRRDAEARKKKAIQTMQFQRKQNAEKRLGKEQEAIRGKLEAQKAWEQLGNEEKVFQAFVDSVFADRPVEPQFAKPMEMLAGRRMPSSE
eukprot:ANDGO_06367.mRNA.1 hypothetical protein (macronuclear)